MIHKLKATTILGVKVFKEGIFSIAIDDQEKTGVPVKVIFGKEHFFKCEVKMGLWLGKPTIESESCGSQSRDGRNAGDRKLKILQTLRIPCRRIFLIHETKLLHQR